METIKFDDNTNVKHIHDILNKLKKAINETDDYLILDFSNTNQIDLSFAQILISLIKTAKQQQKQIKIKGANDIIKNQLKLCKLIKISS